MAENPKKLVENPITSKKLAGIISAASLAFRIYAYRCKISMDDLFSINFTQKRVSILPHRSPFVDSVGPLKGNVKIKKDVEPGVMMMEWIGAT